MNAGQLKYFSSMRSISDLYLPNQSIETPFKTNLKRLNQIHRKKLIDDLALVDFISLTTNFWRDHSSHSYVCIITEHWFTDDIKLKSKVLLFTPFKDGRTSENISLELEKHLNSSNILEKITTMIWDVASNLKSTLKKISTGIHHLHCTAHKINFITRNSPIMMSLGMNRRFDFYYKLINSISV